MAMEMSKLGVKSKMSLKVFHWLPYTLSNFKDSENEFSQVGVFDESELLTWSNFGLLKSVWDPNFGIEINGSNDIINAPMAYHWKDIESIFPTSTNTVAGGS